MIYLEELNERISKETLLMVYSIAKLRKIPIHFDKLGNGNGGSTAFLSLPTNDEVDIMIAPNVAVVRDKELQYKANPDKWGKGKNIRFIHKSAIDKNVGIDEKGQHPDIIVIVVESFFILFHLISKYTIGKILIDECHSVRKQAVSKSRPKLVNLQNKLQKMMPEASIVRMTATPNQFDKVDVKLVYPHIKPMDIFVTPDRESVLKNIKSLVKNGEKVSLFSNNARNVVKLSNGKDPLIIKEVIGKKFRQSIYKYTKIKSDENSNFVLASSRGYEGWDDERLDVNNFFLEDRSQSWDSASRGQMKQALERTRKGAKSNTYCRMNISKRKEIFPKGINKEIDDFLSSNRSPEQMMSKNIASNPNMRNSSKKKNKFLPFLHQEIDENGVVTVTKKVEAVEDYLEHNEWDKNLQNKTQDPFWTERSVTFRFDDAPQSRGTSRRKSEKIMIENLYYNQDEIRRNDTYGKDFKVKILDFTGQCIGTTKATKGTIDYHTMRILYSRLYKEFIFCKNYDNTYVMTPHQKQILDILSINEDDDNWKTPLGNIFDWKSYDEFGKLCSDLVGLYKQKQDEKNGFIIDEQTGFVIGKKSKEQKIADAEKFAESVPALLSQLLLMLANERASVPQNWTVNRDYNLTTKVSMRMIKHLTEYVDRKVFELDIRTSNSRILYALVGKTLPDDFYGVNKVNKTKINMLLNDFFYDEDSSVSKKHQKQKKIQQFRKYNFDEDVIDLLFKRWFVPKNGFRGKFASDMAYYEKTIMSEAMQLLDKEKNTGVIRRHDGTLVWDNVQNLSFFNSFKPTIFPTIGGWFKVDTESTDVEKEMIESLEISEQILKEEIPVQHVANSDVESDSIEGWLDEEDDIQITYNYEQNKDNFK